MQGSYRGAVDGDGARVGDHAALDDADDVGTHCLVVLDKNVLDQAENLHRHGFEGVSDDLPRPDVQNLDQRDKVCASVTTTEPS